MPLTRLALDKLGDLDDRIVVAFEHAIKQSVADCMDRPGDKTARTITLEMKITPVVGEGGQCDGAEGEFQIKSKVPARKSKTYSFDVNRRGDLIFSSTSPENVDQATFEDIDPMTGRIERGGKE